MAGLVNRRRGHGVAPGRLQLQGRLYRAGHRQQRTHRQTAQRVSSTETAIEYDEDEEKAKKMLVG